MTLIRSMSLWTQVGQSSIFHRSLRSAGLWHPYSTHPFSTGLRDSSQLDTSPETEGGNTSDSQVRTHQPSAPSLP